jgi:hypothetical protein
MKPIVYDTGVLIAADRNEREVWAEHRVLLESGIVPRVPAPVVAQASRSPRQVQMRRLLRGCDVVPFNLGAAHAAGALLGKAKTKDVVDAAVVVVATQYRADIKSNDLEDIVQLLAAARAKLKIVDL